jgi:hypothetical protein
MGFPSTGLHLVEFKARDWGGALLDLLDTQDLRDIDAFPVSVYQRHQSATTSLLFF